MLTAAAGIAGVILLCWLVFTLAVNALPFFVGVSVGMFAFDSGAGTVGAVALGVGAAALTLVAGRFFFAASTSLLVRRFVVTLFTLPAALAGYSIARGFFGLGEPVELWREAVGIGSAVIVGAVALSRLNAGRPAS